MTEPDDRTAGLSSPFRDLLAKLMAIQQKTIEQGFRITVVNVREALSALTVSYVEPGPAIKLVRDNVLHGPDYDAPIRIYHPEPASELPVILYLHGGGHVAGSVALYDPICRKIAVTTNHLVVAVEYRLAPECPYPAGLKDAMVSAKRIFKTLGALAIPHLPRLILMGDSGGAALCATISHQSQYEPGYVVERQVLIYPSLDYTLSQPSTWENGSGFFLERERIIWMFEAYFQNQENRRAVSPLFMEVTPEYPPTLVVTAEFDPLRDEGQMYVRILREAGVRVEHLHHPDMIHAFLNMEQLAPEACRRTYAAINSFLNE
ncbi:MAG: alpha/beta hydrolase [Desulfopila sp.]